MKKTILKKSFSNLKSFGVYQIAGGLVGLISLLFEFLNGPHLREQISIFYPLATLLYAYSVYCGILYLRISKNALKHSLANQLLQVIGFIIGGVSFKYVAGIYLRVGIDWADAFKLVFGAGLSEFEFNFNNRTERLELDFNIVAFVLICRIGKLIMKKEEELLLRQSPPI